MIFTLETPTFLKTLSLSAAAIAFVAAGLSIWQRERGLVAPAALICLPFVFCATFIVWNVLSEPYLPAKPPFIGFHTLALCMLVTTQLVALGLFFRRHRIAALAVSLSCICGAIIWLF
ncbi:hypothetical protein [Shimia sediminis]|uniref:hypothetical protein n=1 Tax=Shimia sediminis TaxID=2497945 RepID=UPI000F8E0EE9|nr:hypothetical protein [Shimia sediminis]